MADVPRPSAVNWIGAGAGLVLIVDDVPDNLAVLHDALDESGYTVLVATDAPSAIARAAQVRPDIVLLDALMPDMDGFEVARRMKADQSTAPIPIVFMTALTDTEHVLAAFAAGGVDYVPKPVRPLEVVARVGAHLRSARHAVQARNALDALGHASIALRFRLTAREAEVLYWVAQGKTNRDIGEILGTSPKTVTKHLEHVFEKLGVETRTAAAARVIGALPELGRH